MHSFDVMEIQYIPKGVVEEKRISDTHASHGFFWRLSTDT